MSDSGEDVMRIFRKLSVNNALANYRLSRATIALSQDAFEARRTSFFPSLKITLNHIYLVDWLYIDAVLGSELGPWPHATDEPYGTAAELYEAQKKLDIELFAYCQNMAYPEIISAVEIDRGDRIQIERADDVLSHLFQHQTHHRGQVHAMLAGTSIKPPQLDEFIVADDARFRRDELAAFGWDETVLNFEPPPGYPRLPFPS